MHEFLEEAHKLFELHIYTMGDKHYAAEIKKILDPAGRLFASTISQVQQGKGLRVQQVVRGGWRGQCFYYRLCSW